MAQHELSYVGKILAATRSLGSGLRLTLKHIIKARNSRTPVGIDEPDYFLVTEGINTIQYPYEMQPVPETGRYRLHNEIDDCIVCDKCAKVCPVNCITIEPVKSPEEFGRTSDNTPKRIYAATFDIDMGKCCFCGLCTTVCPTECLTMTPVYDYSVFNIREHHYAFAEMSATEIETRKQEWQQYLEAKEKVTTSGVPATPAATVAPKPVFKPRIKPSNPPAS